MTNPTKKQAAQVEKQRLQDVARKAAHRAPPESARMIVELGQERLKALQAGGIALDARTTQVAAFQLAAAAFASGLTAADKVSLAAAVLAGLGCLAFVIGSGLAFWGMRSCDNQVAGVDPSFWSGALTPVRFNDKLARSWAAEVTEGFIVDARKVDEVRARWLNRSLVAGGAGAVLVLGAAGMNVADKWNGLCATSQPQRSLPTPSQ